MNLTIESQLWAQKSKLLKYFKSRGEESQEEISRNISANDYKEKASEINKAITKTKDKLTLEQLSKNDLIKYLAW